MFDVGVVFKYAEKARVSQFSSAGLRSGAKHVLILGLSDRANVMVALGANDHFLQDQKIISNGPAPQTHLRYYCVFCKNTFSFLAGHMITI